MKQFDLFNLNKSSRCNSRYIAMPQLMHRVVAILVLAFVCSGAWAVDFVIKSGDYYIGMNSAGNALEAKTATTFDESCIWTSSNNLSTTSQSVQNKKYTTKYLRASCDRSGGTSKKYTWTLEVGETMNAWRSDGTNFYAYYSSGGYASWNRSASLNATGTNSISLSDNNKNNSSFYVVSDASGGNEIISTPTISCTGLGSGNNTVAFTHTNFDGISVPAHKTFTVGSTTYYIYNNKLYDNKSSFSTSVSPTYTWSITQGGNYAEIDGTGKLTLKGNPTSDQTITVQLVTSNIAPFDDQTTTYDLVLTRKNGTSTYTNINLSYNAINGGIQLAHTNTSFTSLPARSTFDINGTTYIYYNNTIYENADDIRQTAPEQYVSYVWSIKSGNATIDSATGLLTLNSTESQTVTAQCVGKLQGAPGFTNMSTNPATFNITTTKTDAVSPKPTFTYALASDNSGLQLTPKVTSNYIPAYCTIKTGSTTRGYYDGTSYTTAVPTGSSVSDANFAWTATNGTVNSNILSFNGTSPATVKVTATKGNYYSAESDVTSFTLTEEDPDPEAVTPDIVVTPKTATLGITNQPSLGYSNTQVFSIPETLEAVVKDVPEYTKIVSGTNTYYKHENGKYYTNTPAATSESQTLDFTSATWTASETGYVTITPNANGKTATVVYDGKPVGDDNTRITITANAKYGEAEKSGRAIVSLLYSYIDVTGITATDKDMFIGENDKVSLTITPDNNNAGIVYENFTYTTDPTGIITIDADGTIHAVNPGTTTVTVTYSDADKPDHPALRPKSASGANTTFKVTVGIKAPTIKINDDGTFTITDNNVSGAGATIKYTTDGSDPVANGRSGTSGTVTTGQTVKAVAIKGDGTSKASTVVSEFYAKSGVSGDAIIINDYEDHTWTYYQPVADLPENYPTGYLHSPDPRNVKISYRGGGVDGASAVAISGLSDEGQNEMVYYKTLEKTVLGMTGNYPYQVISNPFSKRPRKTGATGNNGYYGFAGWKVISGGEYIQEHANNDVLGLDEIIHFTNLDTNYTPNCTSGEIVFEATWTQATVKTGTTAQSFTGGNYETNFWVLSGNTGSISIGSPCTVSARYPDGTSAGNYSIGSNNASNISTKVDNVKIEFLNLNTSGAVTAGGYNFTMGRGITWSRTAGQITCGNQARAHTVKIESGKYGSLYHFTGAITDNNNNLDQFVVLGNDYDRAKGDNTKLEITGQMIDAYQKKVTTSNNHLYLRSIIKSGSFMTDVSVGTAAYSASYYFGGYGSDDRHTGRRFLTIEGGEFTGSVCGGTDNSNHGATAKAFDLRVRGNAIINGAVYGGAENAQCYGVRTMIFTGGTIKGWVCGAANGTSTSNGNLTGTTYLYVGGKAYIDSNGNDTKINGSIGGNVFAAGCGTSTTSGASSGRVDNGTNLVIADKSYIERGAYGGGALGSSKTDQTTNIFITGGHVAGKNGCYQTSDKGGVFGGACQQGGGKINITMTGGLIEGGLFGGSNTTGTIALDVTMKINGGQVGTTDASANIHGGGYGQNTKVSQNVEITLGKTGAARDAEGVTVYGDVYGGSALGSVNGTAATNTYHTYLTMNAGYIHGSLYGGALGATGTAANVYGPVQVKVYGGSVMKTDENGANGSGAVYGCNNINGAPQRAVSVDIYGTNSAPAENQYALYAVYGGGNKANYSYGTPTVTVHNCDNSIEYVYGGGNAADITGNGHGTNVTIWGGDVIGNVFGGGNGTVTAANVAGAANVTIHGGTILNVFGGSNSQGTIGGTINVNVAEQAESGHDLCPINIDNVFGGGNLAPSAAANMTIGCASHIGAVYGGANQANITSGNIDLKIAGGNIDNVFGGNNISGTISGTIKVTVNEDKTTYPCGMVVGNVFGAGNLAAYTGSPTVNIENGHLTGSVFGGGKGDATDESHATGAVTGNPQVTIGDDSNSHKVIIDGNVFGGGDAANVIGKPKVIVQNCNTVIGTFSDESGTIDGTVYGGGNAAHITGEGNGTSVTINGGTIYRVFGGGNGEVKPANIAGNAVTNIHAGIIGQVFAGSNEQGSVGGTASATIDHDNTDCNEKIDEVYGGGNLAAGNAGAITVECGAIIGDLYGGANQANVTSDITLNITGGTIDRVFGGNNTSGNVMGSIIVNVNKDATCDLDLGSVFGGGNQAAYSVYGYDTDGSAITSGTAAYNNPQVNIKNGTVKNNVYGGGLGATAIVYGAPQVTIGDKTNADWVAAVGGDVYGGGDAGNVVGTPKVRIPAKENTTIANVYGGGNAADVSGTDVNIDGGNITGMVFGGGHGDKDADPQLEANVNGDVKLYVTGGTINKVFAGSNSKGNISGDVDFRIEKGDASNEMHITEVYGGGNEAAGNAGTILIGCTGGATEGIGDVYGGANAADINSDITLNITGGNINNVFGGNNTSGSISGDIEVNVNWKTENPCGVNHINNVYGGGNLATYGTTANPKGPVVNIKNGTISQNVYGGGKGDPADHTKGQVTGNPVVNIGYDSSNDALVAKVDGDVYGGGDAGNVVGTPQVNVINKCNTTIANVYGGGNAADVSGTDVNIDGGNITGMVFGGGHGSKGDSTVEPAIPAVAANVGGNVSVDITGGTINKVFGGSNANGNITGTVAVNINKADGHCDMKIQEVYGGGNEAAGNAGTITIGCTGDYETNGEGIVDVYGGANAADIKNAINLTIKGGHIDRVFGGNNASGSIVGPIVVNVDWDDAYECGKYLGNVFGGGNLAGYASATTVNMKKGTVSHNIYGGGNEAGVGSATVNMIGGEVLEGVYGGCNTSGTVTGNIAVNVTNGTIGTDADHEANVHGGGYGKNTATEGNVTVTIAQGEGKSVNIWGDVYGGSALGNVNNESSDLTKVQLDKGTIHGCLYGGGLGAKNGVNGATEDVAALVNGTVNVIVNGGTVTEQVFGCNNVNGTPKSNVTVTINGTNAHTPASGTEGQSGYKPAVYAISEVYGGGNMANYSPTGSEVCKVVVNNCESSIGYVYGGGNAADVTSTDVTINGGIIGQVFGGGHGDKTSEPQTEANVSGNVAVKIYGGTINQVFAGSNSKGNISGSVSLTVNKQGEGGSDGCPMHIGEVYGGGNLADGNAGSISIGCTGGTDEGIGTVYGGANNANIGTSANHSDITLNITGGSIDNVFGGNNNGGTIYGTITVNANWTGTCGTNKLGNVYGAGNIAEYTGNPTVNIINCTTTGSIFGGGKGKEAVVVGNPTVNIGDWDSSHHVEIGGNVFGGGDLAAVEGDPKVTVNDCGTLIKGDLYGGGNAAPVYSTNLTMWGGTVNGNVFGGGNGKDLTKNENGAQIGYKRDDSATGGTGNAVAKIFGGTVGTWNGDGCTAGGGIFGGSNTKGNVRGEVQLTIDQQKCADAPNACDLKVKEIYGAGNEAAFAGTGINFNLGCVSALSEIYGGAKNADLSGDVHLIISSGHFNKVFAGNNLGGSINGSIKVTIEETGCNPVIIDELYGGGNMAAYKTPSGKAQPEVEVISCTHIGQVFGGGYGKSAVVTGNPVVNINQIPGKFAKNIDADSNGEADNDANALGTIGTVFGGGNAANVVGNTNVNIGTAEKVTLSSGDSTYKNQTFDVKGVNITGNVYGGGNAADVTGKTNVTVGR